MLRSQLCCNISSGKKTTTTNSMPFTRTAMPFLFSHLTKTECANTSFCLAFWFGCGTKSNRPDDNIVIVRKRRYRTSLNCVLLRCDCKRERIFSQSLQCKSKLHGMTWFRREHWLFWQCHPIAGEGERCQGKGSCVCVFVWCRSHHIIGKATECGKQNEIFSSLRS